MNVNDIRRILIVGTGTMGQKIALQCARFGYDVIAYDSKPAALDDARTRIAAHAHEVVEKKLMTRAESDAALARIRYTANPEDGAAADLVSESVFEDVELKGRVFGQFDRICRPDAIFTTNTSTLLPSMWAAATGRPDRFLALHFYDVWEANADRIKRDYVDRGWLGVKSGRGFHTYPNPAWSRPDFITGLQGGACT